MEGTYEVSHKMGSGAMIYIPSFIKNDSGIRKLMDGGDSETHAYSMVIS
jgi:hypothetical protein